MATEAVNTRPQLFPDTDIPIEPKPASIEVSIDFVREVAIDFLKSRRGIAKGIAENDLYGQVNNAYYEGLTEARGIFLWSVGQDHIVNSEESSINPLVVTPVELPIGRLKIIAAAYESARRFYVEHDIPVNDPKNPEETKMTAKMIELGSILFKIGQGDLVRKIDAEVGRSKADLKYEKLVPKPQLH